MPIKLGLTVNALVAHIVPFGTVGVNLGADSFLVKIVVKPALNASCFIVSFAVSYYAHLFSKLSAAFHHIPYHYIPAKTHVSIIIIDTIYRIFFVQLTQPPIGAPYPPFFATKTSIPFTLLAVCYYRKLFLLFLNCRLNAFPFDIMEIILANKAVGSILNIKILAVFRPLFPIAFFCLVKHIILLATFTSSILVSGITIGVNIFLLTLGPNYVKP